MVIENSGPILPSFSELPNAPPEEISGFISELRHNYLVLNVPNSAVKLAWLIALGKLKRLLGDLPLGAARFHYVTFEIGEQKQKYRWEMLDKPDLIVEEKMLAQHLSVVA